MVKDHELRAWPEQESPCYQRSEWASLWELYQSVRWVPILRVIVLPTNSRKPLSKQSGKATIIKVEVMHGEAHNTWNRTCLKAVWIAWCWANPSSLCTLEMAEPHPAHTGGWGGAVGNCCELELSSLLVVPWRLACKNVEFNCSESPRVDTKGTRLQCTIGCFINPAKLRSCLGQRPTAGVSLLAFYLLITVYLQSGIKTLL